MNFHADQRGFTGAERALLLCCGLAIVSLLSHLVAQGSTRAAGQARQTLITQSGGTRVELAAGIDSRGAGAALALAPVAAAQAFEAPPGEAPPTQRILNVSWQGQERYYWCGPASTRMALSALTDNLPSQSTLADAMATSEEKGTDHIGRIQSALNSALGTTWYETKVMNNPPTEEQRALLRRDVLLDLGKGYPIVANVVSGWRPPGYPGGTIYHYVTVVGYDQGGDRVLIADPAGACAGGATWCNVPQTYWISIEDLGTWIGGKGYTA